MIPEATFRLIIVYLLAKGASGQCTLPPINQVVYDGDVNTIMTCNSNPNKVSWTVTPTNNELFPSKITNFSDTVLNNLTTFYKVNLTNLTIKTAMDPVGTGASPIAMSGVYIAQYTTSSSSRIGAKLVVVRSGPTCNCTALNSTSNNLTCSVTYADASFNPIFPNVTWTADGNLYKNETLNARTKFNNAFTSTSTITVEANDLRTFRCNLTFTVPQTVSAPYIATNTPAYSAICTPNCDRGLCATPPINQVVYDGDANTIMTCKSNSSKVSWIVTPTNNEQFPSQITNYSDTVTPSLTTFFNVYQTDLTIKTATNPVGTGTSPLATSGMYIAQYSTSSSSRIGAKLVVVRAGPTCNCAAINSTSNSLTCSVTYADGSYNPIYAKVTWTADGSLYSTTILNVRTKVNNAFTSTSTITVDVNDPRIFQCYLAFTNPMSISVNYIATNAPAFSAICTPNCDQGQCMTPPINQVVYEGATNIILTCNSNPNKVSWTVTPTNNELFPSQITNFSDTVTPSLVPFFDAIQTNLIIKMATNPVGTGTSPMAMSGVYIAQYNTLSKARIGAKLIVVRGGPTCNCTAINSTSNNLTCSVTYADAITNPIYAKVTWTVNGNLYSTTTLSSRTKVNNVFTSTSTITVNVSDSRAFKCSLTFTQPIIVTVPYIANNAPAFYATCSPRCG